LISCHIGMSSDCRIDAGILDDVRLPRCAQSSTLNVWLPATDNSIRCTLAEQ
jgi:hypothetical protein